MDGLTGFLGYALFIYSLTCALAATMHVFRITSMFECFQREQSRYGTEKASSVEVEHMRPGQRAKRTAVWVAWPQVGRCKSLNLQRHSRRKLPC